MADSDKYQALLLFLHRAYNMGVKTQEDIETMALNAAAQMVDGTTLVELTFEGGGNSRSVINCEPHIVSLACEAFLAEINPANPLAGVDPSTRYLDFSGGMIEP